MRVSKSLVARIGAVVAMYADRGDVVLLQVERNGLRVVLLATARHARAVSGLVTVPPPA